MIIFRADVEQIINAIIDERLNEIADSLDSEAYYDRDHGGTLESATAGVFDRIRDAIRSNVEETWNVGEKAAAAELERLHKNLEKTT